MQSKKRILFVTPYPFDTAPSQRLRFEQYYNSFRDAGYVVEESSFIDQDFWKIIYKKGHIGAKVFYTLKGYLRRFALLFKLSKYDIIYVHLWVTPLGPPVFESLFFLLHKHIIYDIDDMIYLGETSKNNAIISFLKAKSKILYLLKKAQHVIVSTNANYEFAKKLNKNVTDIPVAIDGDRYFPVVQHAQKSKIVVGWTGSTSTSKYLNLLRNVFINLANNPHIHFLVIGDQNFKINGVDMEAIPWSAETEVKDISRIDIGLYPLPDEEWVHGKGGGKALQYMALGIPTVATAIGAIFRIVEDGKSGYLVNNDEEWINRINILVSDYQLRHQIGLEARKVIEERFSVKANLGQYIKVFQEEF